MMENLICFGEGDDLETWNTLVRKIPRLRLDWVKTYCRGYRGQRGKKCQYFKEKRTRIFLRRKTPHDIFKNAFNSRQNFFFFSQRYLSSVSFVYLASPLSLCLGDSHTREARWASLRFGWRNTSALTMPRCFHPLNLSLLACAWVRFPHKRGTSAKE